MPEQPKKPNHEEMIICIIECNTIFTLKNGNIKEILTEKNEPVHCNYFHIRYVSL